MPTDLRVGKFRVLILFPPREHAPPHVHVVSAGGIAVITLAHNANKQRTMRLEGMTRADARQAERIVADHTTQLLEQWRLIHG